MSFTFFRDVNVIGLTQLLGMLLLRTYALYERNKAVLTLLVITFVGVVAACLVRTIVPVLSVWI